jgi:hypothetical protein
MGVGRDHPVGRGVDPIAEPGREPDADRVRALAGTEDLVVVDALAGAVVDADGAEAGLDRLVEAEADPVRGALERRASRGLGRLEHRVRARPGRESRHGDGRRRDRECELAPHQASRSEPEASGSSPSARRRARILHTARARLATTAAPRPAASAAETPPPSTGSQ